MLIVFMKVVTEQLLLVFYFYNFIRLRRSQQKISKNFINIPGVVEHMNTKYYNWYEGSANFQTTRFISLKGLSFIWPSVKWNIFERSLSNQVSELR